MKRFISFVMLAASAAMLTGIVSCKKAEELKPEEDLPTKFQDDSFVEVELSSAEAEYTGSISIKNENGKAVTYTLNIMGQQDLEDYYNSVYEADYKVIPEGLYSFPDGAAVTFASGETEKSVAFTIDTDGLFDKMLEEGEKTGVIPEYALPVQLSDDEGEIGSWLIYGLKMKYNRLSFTSGEEHINLENAETPVEIKANAVFSSQIGSYSGENTFTVTGCLQVVLKVTALVDLLVPSYGYPVIPPCQACQNCQACQGLADLPLYPTASQLNRY